MYMFLLHVYRNCWVIGCAFIADAVVRHPDFPSGREDLFSQLLDTESALSEKRETRKSSLPTVTPLPSSSLHPFSDWLLCVCSEVGGKCKHPPPHCHLE